MNLELERKKMEELIRRYGVGDSRTIKQSQKLDKLILKIMKNRSVLK